VISEQRFRFRNYSPRRLESARWHLFEFDEVRDMTHLEGDIVVVRYEGEPPQIKEWTALLEEARIHIRTDAPINPRSRRRMSRAVRHRPPAPVRRKGRARRRRTADELAAAET
jgi:hypothetical protein